MPIQLCYNTDLFSLKRELLSRMASNKKSIEVNKRVSVEKVEDNCRKVCGKANMEAQHECLRMKFRKGVI